MALIIIIFMLCHVHRLIFRVYEMAHPEASVYHHFKNCNDQGRYHVPVAIYFLTQTHYLFLAINSSANFVIYCVMGEHFRQKLYATVTKTWRWLSSTWAGLNYWGQMYFASLAARKSFMLYLLYLSKNIKTASCAGGMLESWNHILVTRPLRLAHLYFLCSKMGFFKKSDLRLVRVECFHFPQK